MRILRLDLLRYGPFTGKALSFRRNAKLHLVFGPNEAGKSSSLAAIGDLLFGFPKRREYDFLHEASTLRVGAQIAARDGSQLEFRRRRGNKHTLLSASDDETPLQDDALSSYLGLLSREVFSRAFGLDSEALRKGGSAMLESEGELGSALFAAASGLTGLARLRRGLDAEADAIFAPRASKERRFYQALERYDAAITAERRNELKSGEWKALVEEIGEIERQLADIKQQRTETTAALTQLQRLKVLGPIIAAIDQLGEELASFDGLPEVAEGFVADCLRALEAAENASDQERVADEEHGAVATVLAGINVDEAFVARSADIIELFSRKGDYLSKLGEAPRLELERDEFNRTLADLARRLGYADPEDMVQSQPSEPLLETGRGLVEAGVALETLIATEETRLGEELASVDAQEAGEFAASVTDPKPFRDQLAALGPELKQLEDLNYLETSRRNNLQKLAEGAMRLVPQVADFEQLVRVALPSRDTVAAHRDNFEHIVAERRAETLRLEANLQQHDDAEASLTETEQSGPVAYEETIRLVRADREATFALLRDQLLRSGHLLTPMQLAEQVVRYEEEVAEADSIADQAIADAHRISRLAAYRDQIAKLEQERPAIEERLRVLGEEQSRAAQAYGALFDGTGIIPLGPDAMTVWLTAVEDLFATRRDIAALEAQIATLEGLGRQVQAALAGIGRSLGVRGDNLPPLALARLISATLDDVTQRWTARLSFEGARQATRLRIGQIEDGLAKAQRDYKAWRERFDALLPVIGLPPDTSAGGAAAALAVWAQVPEVSRQRANRDQRLVAIERDIDAFESAVGAFGKELAPLHSHLPPAGLIDVLRERAETARAAKTRYDDAQARLEAAANKLAAARGANEAAFAALSALAALLPAGSDPRAELGRLEQRDRLRARLAEQRRAFEAAAEGVSEAVVRSELPSYDRARAPFDVEDLERRAEALHHENNRLYALLGQKHADRDRLEAGTGSEFAAFERQSAEAEIVTTARQWAVRKIAATMLAAAMEKHRETQSDPLVLRAGALFAMLTGGAFSTLLQDYGEDDNPRLVGERPNGNRVPISGMSEGTRDQLYLALRLAYIEDFAGRTEPMPFIGDDIFQTFDDERTAAGIKAFASTSELFQPILFTHHLSVVAIARQALGADLDYIEL
jgi:chromosome segregation protein